MKHSAQSKFSLPAFIMMIALLLSACGSSNQSTAAPTATTAPNPSPSPTATQTPGSTPTSNPTVAPSTGPAVLGATLGAFVAKFGQPNDHSSDGMPHFQRYSDSNIDYLILLQEPQTKSFGQRITAVTVQADDSNQWDIANAEITCKSFMPSDAVFQKRIDVPGSPSQYANFNMEYFSATLAASFAADQFNDSNSNMVKRGLFDVNYLYADNNSLSRINSCDLSLGTDLVQQ